LNVDAAIVETTKKTSILDKIASQQAKPIKKFLQQGTDHLKDDKETKGGKDIKGKRKTKSKKKDGCLIF
jgi:hypothetical protein